MKYPALALLMLASCAAPTAPVRPVLTHDAPAVVRQFHGDVDFSYKERALIANAVAAIEYQTAGLYRIGLVYDLDFQAGAEAFAGSPWLVRAESSFPWLQVVEFKMGGQLLGVTLDGRASYLVMDRLEDPKMLQHVAMHEIFHVGGLKDLDSFGDVMSRVTRAPVTCMSPADRVEFCRVNLCSVNQLNGCNW